MLYEVITVTTAGAPPPLPENAVTRTETGSSDVLKTAKLLRSVASDRRPKTQSAPVTPRAGSRPE